MVAERTYGFRHDPMAWARQSDSLEAALARLAVLDAPAQGDAERIRDAAATFVGALRREMNLCRPSAELHDLIQIACENELIDRRALADLIKAHGERDKDGLFGPYETIAMCAIGCGHEQDVPASVAKLAAKVMEENPWHTCPWGMFLKLRCMWLGRDVADVHEPFEKLLEVVASHGDAAGCFADKDPMSRIDVCGVIDHPKARLVVEKALPMILRGQDDDGGWGKRSFQVFRALHRNGVIDALADRPPLPPDWRVVKTLAAPEGELFTMAWGEAKLWVLDVKEKKLVGVSPEDGSVLVTHRLPEVKLGGIGWVGGAIALTRDEPKMLLRVEPTTGDVTEMRGLEKVHSLGGVAQRNGTVLVCDTWMPCAWEYELTGDHDPAYRCFGGPEGLAADGEGFWRFDWLAPLLLKTDGEGKLIEYGDRPFGRAVKGIAHDGEHLWVLDSAAKRICAIERCD